MIDKSEIDVAVVIPLFNHEKYISSCLDSVLSQTLLPREIIVIDDGSSDGSLHAARRRLAGHPNAKLLTQSNSGAHATINRGVELASCDYIAVLNSDDNFKPYKLSRCAALLDEMPDADLIFGKVALIDQNGKQLADGETVDWLERARRFLASTVHLDLALLNENFAATTSNMFFRKSLWQRNGGFQPLRYCHDLAFCFASNRNGRLLFDQETEHIEYRVHATNTIKEDLTRIRVEIACVLADGLTASVLSESATEFDDRTLALFDKAVTDKGLSTLLPFLMSRRSNFATSGQFFDWAIGNTEINFRLRNMLSGKLSADRFLENGRIGARYISGTATAGGPPVVFSNRVPLDGGPVAIELSAFDRGGLEKVVLDTSVAMKARGLNSIVISCRPVGHLGEVARQEGITVYELPAENYEKFYSDILRRHSVKLSISHFSRVGYPIFRKLGVPNITYIHNVYAFLDGVALDHFKNDDTFVDMYIAVSQKAADYAVGRLGIRREKIVTVPNGLLTTEHARRAAKAQPISRERYGISSEDYLFLNVASYNLHKGHYLMAAAMKLVLAKTDRIKILCIGNTIVPHHFEAFQEYLKRNGLHRHLLMPGYVPEVAPFHAVSDAFLLPSLIEGWSIAMNEAMFFEKPLLMTDTGGASDVINNNDIGILLPNEYGSAENLDSRLLDEIAYNRRYFKTAAFLARAMLDFYENPDFWRSAGKKGKLKVIRNYEFSHMVERYFEIFETIVKR